MRLEHAKNTLPFIVSMMSKDKGVKVIMQGSQAMTTGECTVLPCIDLAKTKYAPVLQKWIQRGYDPEEVTLALMNGLADHEAAGHNTYTDFTTWKRIPCDEMSMHFSKVIEDPRVDRLAGLDRPGCKINLRTYSELMYGDGPSSHRQLSPQGILHNYILSYLELNVLDHDVMEAFIKVERPMLDEAFTPEFTNELDTILKKAEKARDTDHTVFLGQEITALVKKYADLQKQQEQPSPSNSQEQEDDEQKKSASDDSQNQDEAGSEGDSEQGESSDEEKSEENTSQQAGNKNESDSESSDEGEDTEKDTGAEGEGEDNSDQTDGSDSSENKQESDGQDGDSSEQEHSASDGSHGSDDTEESGDSGKGENSDSEEPQEDSPDTGDASDSESSDEEEESGAGEGEGKEEDNSDQADSSDSSEAEQEGDGQDGDSSGQEQNGQSGSESSESESEDSENKNGADAESGEEGGESDQNAQSSLSTSAESGDSEANMQPNVFDEVLNSSNWDELPKGRGEMLMELLNEIAKDCLMDNLEIIPAEQVEYPKDEISLRDESKVQAESSYLAGRLNSLLQSRERRCVRHQRYGRRIDPRRAYRIKLKDTKVFLEEEVVKGRKVAIHFMIDNSGSMRARDLDLAMDATLAMGMALRSNSHFNLALTAFPGYSEMDCSTLIRHGEPFTNEIGITSMGYTPLGQAVWRILPDLLSCKEERKILFVVTDGGPTPKEAAQQALEDARSRGVEAYGLGVGVSDSDRNTLFNLFGDNFRCISSISELAEAVFEMLEAAIF